MIIGSIDLKDGKVVQLRQGKELALERDRPEELAKEFNRYGDIAIIDLDAALGSGANSELMESLLHLGDCRVGGGIKTVERAKELVKKGAKKIIIGSTAFRTDEGFGVNSSFLKGLSQAIGRERIIVAVDARNGKIVVDGWKTETGLDLVETALQVEKWAGELLFTCTEREGLLGGIDMQQVRTLSQAVSCQVTAAGGITSLEEIRQLAEMGCNAQLGMAVYTGKLSMAEAFVESLNWKKVDLIPLIAQSNTGQVLMTGYTDRDALLASFQRNKLCFFSRTRQGLWMKGETSGNSLELLSIRHDCDRDALLARVVPAGPTCHTGSWSCFGQRQWSWQDLHAVVSDRFKNPSPASYTATLDDERVREKIMEEAEEVCTAKGRAEIIWEVADLLYFATVLMAKEKVSVEDVLAELAGRHKK